MLRFGTAHIVAGKDESIKATVDEVGVRAQMVLPGQDLLVGPLGIAAMWHERVLVVSVSGDVDLATTSQLSFALVEATGSEASAVVVDLREVGFLGSSGMCALTTTQRRLGKRTPFAVVAVGPATARPMQLTGLDQTLDVYDCIDTAIAAVS